MTRTFIEALYDPLESPFLRACMSVDGGIVARRRYLAFLTDQRDARGEALRLYLLLTAARDGDDPADIGAPPSELRVRLRAQLPQLDSAWWHAVANAPEIFSCGNAGKDADRRVRFQHRCPNNWDTLEPTTRDERRFCVTCGEHVHWANTLVRAETLVRQGTCIAVPAELASAQALELTRHATGHPDWRSLWASRLFGDRPDD